jgi:ribosomal 50S subunit-recycling heat shock protein
MLFRFFYLTLAVQYTLGKSLRTSGKILDAIKIKRLPIICLKMTMRLDKWLKVSRIIKRRTVAQMACDQGRIFINERPAKSSVALKIGDLVHLELGSRAVTVKVCVVPTGAVPAQEAGNLYEVIEEIRRPPEILEWLPDDL